MKPSTTIKGTINYAWTRLGQKYTYTVLLHIESSRISRNNFNTNSSNRHYYREKVYKKKEGEDGRIRRERTKKIPLKKISFAHLILHPHHHLQQEKEVTLMISW